MGERTFDASYGPAGIDGPAEVLVMEGGIACSARPGDRAPHSTDHSGAGAPGPHEN